MLANSKALCEIINILKYETLIDDKLIIPENFEMYSFDPENTVFFIGTNYTINISTNYKNCFFTNLPIRKFKDIKLKDYVYVYNYLGSKKYEIAINSLDKVILLDIEHDLIYLTTVISSNNILDSYIITKDELYILSKMFECSIFEIDNFYKDIPLILGPQQNFDFDLLKRQVELYEMSRY